MREKIPFEKFVEYIEVNRIHKLTETKEQMIEYQNRLQKMFDEMMDIKWEDFESLSKEDMERIPLPWIYDWLHVTSNHDKQDIVPSLYERFGIKPLNEKEYLQKFKNEEGVIMEKETKISMAPKVIFGYDEDEEKRVCFNFDEIGGRIFVTGGEGTGKTNFLKNVIEDLIECYRDEVELYVVGGKKDEYDYLETSAWVIQDEKEFDQALSGLVEKIEDRYELFSDNRVLRIEKYNSLDGVKKITYKIFIIDEISNYADNKQIIKKLKRILDRGRAAGVYVIIASENAKLPDDMNENFSTILAKYDGTDKEVLELLNSDKFERNKIGGELEKTEIDEAYFISHAINFQVKKLVIDEFDEELVSEMHNEMYKKYLQKTIKEEYPELGKFVIVFDDEKEDKKKK